MRRELIKKLSDKINLMESQKPEDVGLHKNCSRCTDNWFSEIHDYKEILKKLKRRIKLERPEDDWIMSEIINN